ncbi:hypothetical protein C2S52_001113 [Perilla frutescens var. hirtella]|nr:hypothetical protein C2S52_001113 [Perilla frutescens var. hirtella]
MGGRPQGGGGGEQIEPPGIRGAGKRGGGVAGELLHHLLEVGGVSGEHGGGSPPRGPSPLLRVFDRVGLRRRSPGGVAIGGGGAGKWRGWNRLMRPQHRQ